MLTLLFWNVGAESRLAQIADLATKYDVDVILLAEVADEPIDLLLALNKATAAYNYAPGIWNTKIHVFTRFSADFIMPLFETDRLTIRRLNPPGTDEVMLAVVHFPSKYAWTDESQILESTRLADDIRRLEESRGHRNTILVGDLNMNPFETGVVSAAGMHAVMDRNVAQRGAPSSRIASTRSSTTRCGGFSGTAPPVRRVRVTILALNTRFTSGISSTRF